MGATTGFLIEVRGVAEIAADVSGFGFDVSRGLALAAVGALEGLGSALGSAADVYVVAGAPTSPLPVA